VAKLEQLAKGGTKLELLFNKLASDNLETFVKMFFFFFSKEDGIALRELPGPNVIKLFTAVIY
jgi:hypothetical protein